MAAERRNRLAQRRAWIVPIAASLVLGLSAQAQENIEAVPVEPVEAQELAPPPPREFSGTAVAIDSATIQIGDQTLTLYGLTPFRSDWRAEAAARAALDELVRDVELQCTEAGHDRFRRILATCSAAELDISEAMLGAGMSRVDRTVTWARSADQERAARYDAAERAARDASAGLWIIVPGYQHEEPTPPPPGLWDRVERFQSGIAVLAGMVIVAIAIAISGRRRRR